MRTACRSSTRASAPRASGRSTRRPRRRAAWSRRASSMVASIGNNGPGGSSPDALFAAGAPGVGNEVIGVASFDNAQLFLRRRTAPVSATTPATGSPLRADQRQSADGADRDDDDDRRCLHCAAGRQPDRKGGADPPRHLLVLHEGDERRRTRALPQSCSTTMPPGAITPTVAGTPADHDPGRRDHGGPGRGADGLIAAGTTTLTWDDDYVSASRIGTGGLISGFSSFGLARRRLPSSRTSARRAAASSRAIRSNWAASAGSFGHLDVGTARRGRRGADPGSQGRACRRKRDETRLQNSADPKAWSGNPALGVPGPHLPPGRRHAGHPGCAGCEDRRGRPAKMDVGESAGGPEDLHDHRQATGDIDRSLTTSSHVAGARRPARTRSRGRATPSPVSSARPRR